MPIIIIDDEKALATLPDGIAETLIFIRETGHLTHSEYHRLADLIFPKLTESGRHVIATSFQDAFESL